ncbi:uncharacterized protein LOC116192212 [Punica granatum]|uniref:DUF7880 domain-containing protein n=2 Tax=Punica granatum TaxID=22663 RepID=A0A218VTG8_PUNGR|nr:uncharacterized protein LOC116192212 [Punica granatum]OWM63311.1 hypothetical protein CDL15_Pgr022056 [Punica granatum]PKI70055.1 hypothetical protein CRG98_009518 [Punica granatum]
MAIVTAPVQVSIGRFTSLSSSRPFSSTPAQRPRKPPAVKCSHHAPEWGQAQSRRLVSMSLLLSHCILLADQANAGSFFDKYVKRKKLDPLDAYVPAVILTELQIKDLEKNLEGEKPEFSSCRSLLRSGPAASFRVNIRAVAQYASDSGNGKTAFDDVDQCLRALEELDSLLLHASRNEPDASVNSMKAKIGVALNALDGLLKTVPQDVLEKGKAIADAYRAPDDGEPEPDISDPEIKQLESIL